MFWVFGRNSKVIKKIKNNRQDIIIIITVVLKSYFILVFLFLFLFLKKKTG